MISTILLTLMFTTGCWSSTDDSIFGSDIIVERDGYVVGHKTFQYDERQTQRQDRFSRAVSGYRTDYSQREIKEILDYHNNLRTQVNPNAANMEYMEWDDQLAHMAQEWAENCNFQHGQTQNLSPYDIVGQNLFVGSGAPQYRSGVYAAQKWFEEEQWYTYDTDRCQTGEMCGHYTQVVWASTNKVGCGRYQCPRIGGYSEPNAYLLVCNYGPTGNFNGEKPYDIGPACSQCPPDKPRCFNGLCHDCSPSDRECECRLRCENCGTLNENRCSCNCMNGWMGPDCSAPCVDGHEWCGANPGWPTADSCYMFSYVPSKCPKLCGVCNAADKKSKCNSKRPGSGPTPGKGKPPVKPPAKPKKKKKKPKKPATAKPAYCTEIPFAVASIDNEVVMFKKGKMWRFSSSGRAISNANGETVQTHYRRVANGFKAVYQRSDNRVIFVRGADFYVYNGNTLESGPTKLKSVGLKANPSAAFYNRNERKSYFFKGTYVWRFDDQRQRVDSGFPKKISQVFGGVPSKITGAFQNADGDLIFVQGKSYYKIHRGTTQVSGGRKLFHREILRGC